MNWLNTYAILFSILSLGFSTIESNYYKDLAFDLSKEGDFGKADEVYTLIDSLPGGLDIHSRWNKTTNMYLDTLRDSSRQAYNTLAQSESALVGSYAHVQLGKFIAGENKLDSLAKTSLQNATLEKDKIIALCDAYKDALRKDPNNQKALYNYELALFLLDQYKESNQNQDQQDQDQKNQDQENKDSSKDQQKQDQKEQNKDQQDQKENQNKKDPSSDQSKDQSSEQKKDQNQKEQQNKDSSTEKNKDKSEDKPEGEPKDKSKSESEDKPEGKPEDKTAEEKAAEEERKKQEAQQEIIRQRMQEQNMDEEQARRILQSINQQEKKYLQQLQKKVPQQPDSDKPDW